MSRSSWRVSKWLCLRLGRGGVHVLVDERWQVGCGTAGLHAFTLPSRRRQVEAPDEEAEEEVVDGGIDQPDQNQQQRFRRDVEVEQIVDQPGGKAEPVTRPEGCACLLYTS